MSNERIDQALALNQMLSANDDLYLTFPSIGKSTAAESVTIQKADQLIELIFQHRELFSAEALQEVKFAHWEKLNRTYEEAKRIVEKFKNVDYSTLNLDVAHAIFDHYWAKEENSSREDIDFLFVGGVKEIFIKFACEVEQENDMKIDLCRFIRDLNLSRTGKGVADAMMAMRIRRSVKNSPTMALSRRILEDHSNALLDGSDFDQKTYFCLALSVCADTRHIHIHSSAHYGWVTYGKEAVIAIIRKMESLPDPSNFLILELHHCVRMCEKFNGETISDLLEFYKALQNPVDPDEQISGILNRLAEMGKSIKDAQNLPSLVVCTEPIVPGGEKGEGELLAGYKAILEKPLPLKIMPSQQDLSRIELALATEFPWAEQVVSEIFMNLRAKQYLGVPTLHMDPILLVGSPGSGKSRLVHRIAKMLEMPNLEIPLGGNADIFSISGLARGWGNSRPSDVIMKIVESRSASVLVCLDEVDKIAESNHNGNVGSYLLSLLEPETSSQYRDSFIKAPCNLSQVLWIGTANDTYGISAALLSRWRVLRMNSPKQEHYPAIAKNVLVDMVRRWGVDPGCLPSVASLNLEFHKLKSARDVRKATEVILTRHVIEKHESARIAAEPIDNVIAFPNKASKA